MKNLDIIADELFNKIRGRYPSVTVGDQDATITNMPKEGRFFEFDFAKDKKVSISLDEDGLKVMYSQQLFDEADASLKSNWYGFLKELRQFAKKRMLRFDTRDITKNSLDKRDYDYLSTEKQMSESKLYGTSRTSFQDIGSAKMIVKHSGPINHEQPAGRTRDIAGIYIESESGERFKYPMKHLNGARAMARHVAEGGTPYDDFGKHIIGLSEELSKLRKFKTYMNRSSVMAEGLAGYLDVVNERIETVKKTAHALQSVSHYKEAFENFETTVLEEVPEDVSNTWIDELTIKQFNEELKGVFPYIYKLVSEANKVKELGPDDLVKEADMDAHSADMEKHIPMIMKLKKGLMDQGKDSEDAFDLACDKYGFDPDDVSEYMNNSMKKEGTVPEGVTRNALYQKVGKMLGKGHNIDAIKKRFKDIDDAHPGHIEKIVQALKDRNEIPQDLKRIKGSDPMASETYGFEELADEIVNGADFNQDAPMTEYERAFEDFKMAAANAAAKGEKEFEYPKGSGKKHPTKMDKGTAAKLLADSQTNEGGMKQAQIEVQDWFNKFNKYKGTNGDDLAQGWIRATLDTGIMADAYDENELEAFNKMKGYKGLDQDWQDGDHEDFTSNKSGASPITAAMFSTINAIMDKYGLDEEDVDDMSKADDPSYGKPDMRVKDSIEEKRKETPDEWMKRTGKKPTKVEPGTGDAGKKSIEKLKKSLSKSDKIEKDLDAKDKEEKEKQTDEDQRTDELAPLAIPALMTIGRMAVGAIAKGLAKKGAKEAVKGMAKKAAKGGAEVAKQAAKTAKNNPGKVAVGAGGVYAYDKLTDFKDFVVDSVEGIMEYLPEIPGAEEIARMAAKYALPASVAILVAYGGYKLIDKALDGAEEKPQEDDKDSVTVDISPKGQGDELKGKQETPLDEFVKSMYDYTRNAFPKGETAVLTAVQKKYGDEAVRDAQQVIQELLSGNDMEMARIQQLAGLR